MGRFAFASFPAVLVFLGCGDGGMTPDAGGLPDGPIGGPTLPTCDAPLRVAPADDTTVSVELDTTTGAPGALALDPCGGGTRLPQVVIEYVVPGVGQHVVELSTVNAGTPMDLDTVLAVHREACERPDDADFPVGCFDDVATGTENRSQGTVPAVGGDILYIIVTGYFDDDRGPIQIDLTSRPSSAPVLLETTARVVGDVVEIEIVGEDADADATGVRLALFDETRALVDVTCDARATPDDVLSGDLDTPVTGSVRFGERATLSIMNGASVRRARVQLVDEGNAASEPIEVGVQTGSLVGFGATCDGMTTVCDRELQCATAVCSATPARAAACAAAPGLTVPAPTVTTTTASVMDVLLPGTGLFRGPCSSTSGTEDFYTVVVPATPPVDLLFTTAAPGTAAGSDTVLYVRSNCTDPGSSPPAWCDDDGSGLLSTIEIRDAPPGTYTVFVEDYAGVADGAMLRYELRASLRPVLPVGSPCDPDLIMNRCAMTPCSVTTRTCG